MIISAEQVSKRGSTIFKCCPEVFDLIINIDTDHEDF